MTDKRWAQEIIWHRLALLLRLGTVRYGPEVAMRRGMGTIALRERSRYKEDRMSTRSEVAGNSVGEDRRIYNPVQKDYVTFLDTSEETGGKYTRLEIELAPGGGNMPHYHKSYAEHFTVVDGDLEVTAGGETHTLRPGETAVAPINTLHNFRNRTGATTRFLVELRPGSQGFEKALRVGYGLARDGLVRANGVPRNLYHLAVLTEWADIGLPGWFSVFTPLFRILAKRARRIGVDRELEATYIR